MYFFLIINIFFFFIKLLNQCHLCQTSLWFFLKLRQKNTLPNGFEPLYNYHRHLALLQNYLIIFLFFYHKIIISLSFRRLSFTCGPHLLSLSFSSLLKSPGELLCLICFLHNSQRVAYFFPDSGYISDWKSRVFSFFIQKRIFELFLYFLISSLETSNNLKTDL